MTASKGIAIVTGAAQGIGRNVALRLADDGFDVALNDIAAKAEHLHALGAEITQKGRRSSTHPADVSNEAEVMRMIAQVVEVHGSVDVMVANAGILSEVGVTECPTEEWDRIMRVNARGPFLCYKHAGIQMIKQGRGGRIIGASSVAGKQGMLLLPAYCASKFAVRGLTQAAAQEFGAHGITVNAYAPGFIETPMLGLLKEEDVQKLTANAAIKNLGDPGDIASLVSFLASKESGFITGAQDKASPSTGDCFSTEQPAYTIIVSPTSTGYTSFFKSAR